jgi:flagellar biosynthesis protein FliR
VALADFTRPLPAPASVVDFAVLVGCEFVLGFALGLGVHLVIVGLQLAGQIVDTQSGMNLGEIFNPDFGGSGSQTSQLMFWYATALFLLLEPLGGHLQLISLFVRSFDALPVGSAFLAESTGDLLLTLIQQSMVLGLRVAAPLLVVMSLVDLSLGILGHSVPQINLQALGFALRAFVGFLMLILLFSGIVDLLVVAVVDTFELMSIRLLFSSP